MGNDVRPIPVLVAQDIGDLQLQSLDCTSMNLNFIRNG
jgi:hypothetical protein